MYIILNRNVANDYECSSVQFQHQKPRPSELSWHVTAKALAFLVTEAFIFSVIFLLLLVNTGLFGM